MDLLIGTMDNMKNVGNNINDELKLHNNLLGDLDQGIDNNIKHIKKTTSKVDKLLEKSSNCCLFMVIAAEIGIMALLLWL
jgi:hypothetical protein